MRFAKTFCKPSSTVTIVPVGLPVKLEYNEHGLLKNFNIGFDANLDPKYSSNFMNSNESLSTLMAVIKKFVPQTISTKGGTTWVYGVFYTDRIPCTEGNVPDCMFGDYVSDMIKGGHYEFYAGYVYSLAANFAGPLVIRNFLSANKFNMLPQVVVPLTMTDETLHMMMNPGTYPFRYSFIAGYFVFEDMKCRYASNGLVQVIVGNSPEPIVGSDGYIKGEVVSKSDSDVTYTFSYPAIVHHDVTKGSTLLLQHEHEAAPFEILSTRAGEGVEKVIGNNTIEVKCPICGKLISMGTSDAPMQCDDPHCLSSLYNDAVKMLTAFGFPTISYEVYRQYIDSKAIICLTDLLDLQPCKDQEIETTLANAMYAAIPASVAPNFEIIERFANKCNNSVDTVVYYLENPLRIETDLDMVDPLVRKLVSWLKDPYNVSTLTSVFARVKISNNVKKFEGCPIFRGNKIALTGRFKRGSYPEIESILRSYDADVSPSIEPGDKLPDVLLIGSLNDGISGQMVHKAKIHDIPIAYEDDFFMRYEIDRDLAANLL